MKAKLGQKAVPLMLNSQAVTAKRKFSEEIQSSTPVSTGLITDMKLQVTQQLTQTGRRYLSRALWRCQCLASKLEGQPSSSISGKTQLGL